MDLFFKKPYFSSLQSLPALAVILMAAIFVMPSCIEDGVTTSPAHQPAFSTDTLRMGDLFTGADNPTFSFRVYNRNNKILNISSIRLKSGASTFRLNVDGLSGTRFSNIEIRPNDSIYVFVSSTLPVNGDYRPLTVEDCIEFITNGVTSEVVVTATGSDVERHRGTVITADTYWSADRPRQIFDSLVVASGATLTLEAGARLYFHDGASMRVRGSLIAEGTPQTHIRLSGDRTGNVVTDISFELMSRQWTGMYFAPTSRGNSLKYTEVCNTWTGVTVDSAGVTDSPVLTLANCRLRNADGHALTVRHSRVDAFACEFAEAGAGPVNLTGGDYRFIGCTFSNYYLFSAIGGPLLQLDKPASARIINCIFYGSGADILPGDLSGTAVTVERCLLRSAGADDENFRNCLWDSDPLFYTVRSEYLFDYRIRPESPAVGAALPGYESLSGAADWYGAPRTSASLGAYEPFEKQ